MNYVIIGAGIAGVEASLEIRKRDRDGSITILDMDNEAGGKGCIYRPALKEFLAGSITEEELSVHPEGYLDRKGIRIIPGLATSIHPKTGTIEYLNSQTSDPIEYQDNQRSDAIETLPFDRLLIATGAVPRTPDLFLRDPQPKNLFFFKSLMDASIIRWWLGEYRGTCCVVGSGILGMETAELLRVMGRDVVMASRSDNRLFRGIPDGLRRKVTDLYDLQGIRSISLLDISEMVMDGDRISALGRFDGSTIPVSSVILCAGVEPSPLLRESGGYEFSRGIHVDDHMRTTVLDIYAAGDCALMPWSGQVSGPETLRLWEPSRRMGRIAGANMAGGDLSFDPWPMYYHTHLFDVPLGFFGSYDAPEQGYRHIIKESGDSYRELVLKDGRIVGGSFMGGRPYPPPLLQLIRSGKEIPLDPAELLEDTFDQDSLWYL